MKILFYVEPLIEQDKPYWKTEWISNLCKKIINTLKQSDTVYDFLIITNEAISQKVYIDTKIIELNQKELLSPFATTNYLDATTAWHLETYTREQLEYYKMLMLEKLDGFVPDIIITFSPTPFFKYMFKNTLILHHEYSIFSRLPYPQSWFFDPVGMHSCLFLNKFEDEIKSIELTKNQKILINDFKLLCQNILTSKSPFKNIFEEKKKHFDYLVLLPLQFSRYFSFDDLVPFKSQYEYCVYILDNIPSNIGVVVNTHPEYPVISREAIEFLKTKYPNFIFENNFDTVYASGQFILPFVDAVITTSSSIGLQTLLFDKKLITLSNKTFSFIADSTNIKHIEKVLKSKNIDKNSFLYFILTRHAIQEKYLFNQKWLNNFLLKSLNRYRKNNISFDFYDAIDIDQNIFEALSKDIQYNSKFVPQIVSKNFIQLFIEDENGLIEENSIKYPVKQNNEIQKFEFGLKNQNNIKSLKIKPLNDSCVVQIEKIFLQKYNKTKLALTEIITNAMSFTKQAYYFESENSQIYFKNLLKKDILTSNKLIVEIKYLYYGKEALNKCIEMIKRKENNYFTNSNKIIFLGASSLLERNWHQLQKLGIKPDFICDNDPSKRYSNFNGFPINLPDDILSCNEQNFLVLITSSYIDEIKSQLQKYNNILLIKNVKELICDIK